MTKPHQEEYQEHETLQRKINRSSSEPIRKGFSLEGYSNFFRRIKKKIFKILIKLICRNWNNKIMKEVREGKRAVKMMINGLLKKIIKYIY